MDQELFYCSKCRSYVSKEDVTCPVCGTHFSDLISIDKNDLTEIMSFSNEFEAEIVKAKLQESGIQSVFFHESAGELYPSLNNAFGIKLFVHQKDADEARELIKEAEDNTEDRDSQ